MRSIGRVCLFSLACAVALARSSSAPAQPAADAGTATNQDPAKDRDGPRDFDFEVGAWKIHSKRLRNPLTGSTTRVEFEGRSVGKQLWDGRVSQDESVFDDPAGRIEGLTLRFYNPKSREWSIYWASNTFGGLTLPPTVGRFDKKNGRGEFYDHEMINGRMVLVRFLWFDITDDHCRWEQAFSEDGGKTWETNWIQYLERMK